MGGISRWFWDGLARIITWRHQFVLGRKILLLNRDIDSGKLELSFTLCHMILTSIPEPLLNMVDRGDELHASVELRCGDIWRILKHLDECANYLSVQVHNEKLAVGEPTKKYTPITTRSYPKEWNEYAVGGIFMEAQPRITTATLHAELLERIGNILNECQDVELHESVQSYFDRMSHVVLEDCYSLICKLVGLSLNARTQKRPIEIGEDR